MQQTCGPGLWWPPCLSAAHLRSRFPGDGPAYVVQRSRRSLQSVLDLSLLAEFCQPFSHRFRGDAWVYAFLARRSWSLCSSRHAPWFFLRSTADQLHRPPCRVVSSLHKKTVSSVRRRNRRTALPPMTKQLPIWPSLMRISLEPERRTRPCEGTHPGVDRAHHRSRLHGSRGDDGGRDGRPPA